MNTNIKPTLNTFKDPYLKCVVTKYASTMNLMANSGSLIVYSPNEERNCIYLGNNFLASGYGFTSESLVNDAEIIVRRYFNDYDSFVDKCEQLDNKIDKEIKDRKNEDAKLVAIDGGPINNTILKFNGIDGNNVIRGVQVKTIDFLTNLSPAKYKDLEITNIKKTIYYNGSESITFTGDEVELPVGAVLRYIKVLIKYDANDSGGITQLIANHINLYDNTKNEYTVVDITTNQMKNLDNGIVDIRIDFNNELVVNTDQLKLINKIELMVGETPKSNNKYYQYMYDHADPLHVKIDSVENKIQNHIITNIGKIIVKPSYVMKVHRYEGSPGTINNTIIQEVCSDINIKIGNNICDQGYIDLPLTITNEAMFFALPSFLTVTNIEYIAIPNYGIYNWSGYTRKYNFNFKINPNKYSVSNNNVNKKVYLDYTLYFTQINDSYTLNTIKNGIQIGNNSLVIVNPYIRVSFIRNGNPILYNENNELNNNINILDSSNYNYLINENFNSMYWITGNINEVSQKLQEYNINGIIKKNSEITMIIDKNLDKLIDMIHRNIESIEDSLELRDRPKYKLIRKYVFLNSNYFIWEYVSGNKLFAHDQNSSDAKYILTKTIQFANKDYRSNVWKQNDDIIINADNIAKPVIYLLDGDENLYENSSDSIKNIFVHTFMP